MALPYAGTGRTRTGNEGDIRVGQLNSLVFSWGLGWSLGWRASAFFRSDRKKGEHSVIRRSLCSELSGFRRPGNDGQALVLLSSFHLAVENPRGRNGASEIWAIGLSIAILGNAIIRPHHNLANPRPQAMAPRVGTGQTGKGSFQGSVPVWTKKGIRIQDPGALLALGPSDGTWTWMYPHLHHHPSPRAPAVQSIRVNQSSRWRAAEHGGILRISDAQ